jgi:hypothetical protein
VADEGHRSIVRVTPDGEQNDFITHYQGQRLNGPMTFALTRMETFFTDPWGSSWRSRLGRCMVMIGKRHFESNPYWPGFPNGILVGNGMFTLQRLNE